MLSHRTITQPATVPVGLLTAAIDLINLVKPQPGDVDRLVTALVLRLDYNRSTACALITRIRATARMFANPRWPAVRRLGDVLPCEHRLIFEAHIQRFIATGQLGEDHTFDLAELLHELTAALPVSGRC